MASIRQSNVTNFLFDRVCMVCKLYQIVTDSISFSPFASSSLSFSKLRKRGFAWTMLRSTCNLLNYKIFIYTGLQKHFAVNFFISELWALFCSSSYITFFLTETFIFTIRLYIKLSLWLFFMNLFIVSISTGYFLLSLYYIFVACMTTQARKT